MLRSGQRTAEIVVLGPSFALQKRLLTHLCNEVVLTRENCAFGRTRISNELELYFYGLGESDKSKDFAWDLVADKILGFFLLFNWFDGASFQKAMETADELSRRFDAHGVIAGDLAENLVPVNEKLIGYGFSLSERVYFSLWNSAGKASSRALMRLLVDAVMSHLG
ncbi:MAG: hypothetical protein ONA69_03355 [candidate division KSB1 bacterium]|nr:hypothetical protein [candidate division KSB1 bacterium]MDZ7345808.1 hypothetical protein [candidate division KSB1 bacterium]